MRLVYIHGPPAVGKLTVAKKLVKLTDARLFENHASIDLALTVFDHGASGFWDLVAAARVLVIEAAVREEVPLIVMTSCYSDPHDRQTFETYKAVLDQSAAKMCPVFLHCSEKELRRRVSHPDRKARGKIASVSGLEWFLAEYNLVPAPHDDCLKIDTEILPASDAAAMIADHFHLR